MDEVARYEFRLAVPKLLGRKKRGHIISAEAGEISEHVKISTS
jgi:hypothetical protein